MLCWRRVKPIEANSELPIGFWSRLRVGATNTRACRLLAMLFQEDSDSESDSSESEEARMASATAAASLPTHAVPSSQPGHGPLSFMGCMREASPPPRFEETSTTTATAIQHHNNHHHHNHHHHHRPPVGLPIGADFTHISAAGHHAFDSIPKACKDSE
uniref:Uncharacterized protein n=1 Tax=Trichogramma kaykai TaxID=54128 RepID=A0ABD2VW69_9HYME